MKSLKIMKAGYDAETDDNPNHAKFWDKYNTLKYFSKQTVSVLLPASAFGANGSYTHNLGYYPYVEVYVKNPVGEYEYCPSINSGATVEYYSSFVVTKTQVKLFVGSTGFFSDQTFDFIIFIFRNNLGFA